MRRRVGHKNQAAGEALAEQGGATGSSESCRNQSPGWRETSKLTEVYPNHPAIGRR